jgi:hypothetical protein
MSAAHRACGWPLCPCRTHRPRTLRVYTPTPDGFERFLRESVGLPLDTPHSIRPPPASGTGAPVTPHTHTTPLFVTCGEDG